MKIHINPQYEHLRKEITDAVYGNYIATKVFCHKRNIVEKFNMQGKEYVIKIYKQPNIINRIAYTYFRMSKAKRAFIYAERLLALGINTPQPVAYIERRERGLFSTGYFISEYMPYSLMRDAYSTIPDSEKRRFTKDFIDFVLEMHSKKILPLDFNSSNIFYHFDEEQDCYRFAITDINRMRFGKTPSTSKTMRSFEQLGVNIEGVYRLAVYYCAQKGIDIEYSILIFLVHRIGCRIRKRVKYYISTARRDG